MGQPLFLAENFFSVAMFPGHVVTSANAAAPGQEVFRVGTARRSVLNGFRNADPSLLLVAQVELDRIREADTLVIDRNSDVIGRDLQLEVSSDFYITSQIMIAE
ncbi:MAG: hypothetical protein IIB66_03705, partial [Proteobacteria bacterium]|nr:hypothetical protein [Pseudomonadota bacterium]